MSCNSLAGDPFPFAVGAHDDSIRIWSTFLCLTPLTPSHDPQDMIPRESQYSYSPRAYLSETPSRKIRHEVLELMVLHHCLAQFPNHFWVALARRRNFPLIPAHLYIRARYLSFLLSTSAHHDMGLATSGSSNVNTKAEL